VEAVVEIIIYGSFGIVLVILLLVINDQEKQLKEYRKLLNRSMDLVKEYDELKEVRNAQY